VLQRTLTTIARLFVAAVLIVAPGVAGSSAAAAADGPGVKRLLFLSSYHPAFPSFFKQIEGFRAGLAGAGLETWRVTLDVEFMDTKRFPPGERFPVVEAALRAKLARLPRYDVVVAADDNAFRFAVDRRDTLFGGAPLVFLGVGNLRFARDAHARIGAVGVIEKPSQRETLALAARLYPEARRIHVVIDETPTGRLIGRTLPGDVQALGLERKVTLHSLGRMSYARFFETLSAIPAGEPLLLRAAFRDAAGDAREFYDVLQEIRRVYSGAILGVQEHGLGAGLLGGRLVSHVEQGRAAAGLVTRILGGESVSSMQNVWESPNVYTFDHGELKRLDIDRSRLPAGSIVVGRPNSMFNDYREWVIGGAAAITLLSVVIALLAVGVVRQRRSERAIQAARVSAEAANRAKSEFLARMSHELRTPLNAIIGFSTLIVEDPREEVPDDIREFSEYVLKGGKVLLGLINEVLDLARIESGAMEMEFDEVRPSEVVDECLLMARSLAEARGISITRNEGVLPIPSVYADRMRVSQVLLNLLSNAVKYNRDGGTVTLDVSMPAPDRLRFSVSDTGQGIPAAMRGKVFEPFNRLGAEFSAVEGTGIGLTISRCLVEAMGGEMDFQSHEGAGSRFWFDLPVGNAASGRRVLLCIEDNAVNADMMKLAVSQFGGWTVRVASSRNASPAIARAIRPDAIIVDLDRREADGALTLSSLRGMKELADTPVIAIGPSGSRARHAAAIEAGYAAYVSRPLDLDELRAALDGVSALSAEAA
jgi:signal transduction histidine kinase/CheY-like chemotaxis protein